MKIPHPIPRRLAPEADSDLRLGPDSVQVEPRVLAVGDLLATTLTVTGYPAEVGPGWLDPLLTYPGRLDVSLHIEPVPAQVASARLRKQRARLEATRRAGHQHGRLEDPETEAAAADAAELAWRVARGEGKLFRVGLYLTIYATSREELSDELSAVRALAESMLLRCQIATWRALQGWTTCLPFGVDQLQAPLTFDTAALATCFPFSSPDLPATGPDTENRVGTVLYGLNTAASGLVMWDRFAQDNHNSVTLARSGAGKSYLTKLEALRLLYQGVQVFVIDPEDEYTRLTDAVGGTVIRPGAPGVRINPLDLAGDGAVDQLTRRALFLHSFIAVLLGQTPTPSEKALLDTAILTAYRQAGITLEPRTHTRPAPLLADLTTVLATSTDPAGTLLADRLAPYTTGTHSQLFDGPTTQQAGGHLTVYSLRNVPEELKTAATMLTLDQIWRTVTNPHDRRPRLVVIDEAWLLMRDEHGARFLHRMAKSSRKHWAGLAVVTQDTADLLATDLGKAVVANAATQILLRQAPQAIDAVADAFRLSAGEAAYLLAAAKGEALLCSGPGQRAAFTTVASDVEHQLVTTDPAELTDTAAYGRQDEQEEQASGPHAAADPSAAFLKAPEENW
ncbi:VirB4 family type IV secretion system protein [Kitasatospora azatica]|uniref:VirB4 family type IV secretion system protein n=1 Tax=Kitasatospora azatica TaxID=58347 RepID=UPI0007C6FEED|nr:ATP-binding protein [Kitasatospora azatica]